MGEETVWLTQQQNGSGMTKVSPVQRVQLFWIAQCPNIVRNFVTRAKTRGFGVLRVVNDENRFFLFFQKLQGQIIHSF